MPLVSIITPSYNSSKFLLQTYNSIKSQTHENWEWIVTDDCSTDTSMEILQEIAINDFRVKIASNSKNSGAAVARNNSLVRAKGDFIAFVDSDDLWDCDKLRKQISFMESSGVNFSFTAFRLLNENGHNLNKNIDINNNDSFDYNDMLRKKATIGCSTVVLRRCAFEDISMPLIRTGQDYALWLKLLRQNHRAYLLPEALTSYRIVSNSISRNKFKKAKRQWEIYRKIEKLSLLRSLECFAYYSIRAVIR
ncbi:glycosyltransferase family 2 protein [Serratia fonticola]|uniref:glycosyltransferase family 2 protein n=1 Tax=Serratia fonticola TaxID=47917 RepID=UPI0016480E97|nr:glycosyltransferase family 2 protein [Serratia fonticola]MBC3229585.1 glycosyltransferase family 2 protein [Serratia fonticola]